MASRRPPSQRDPEYAPHRLAGLFSQVLPGARVRNAAPVKAVPSSVRTVTPTAAAAITAATQERTEGYNASSTAIGTGATYVPLANVDSLPLDVARDGGGSGAYASPWAHRNVGANHLTIDEEGLYNVAVYVEGNVTGGYLLVTLYESTGQAAWAPKDTILPGSGGVRSLSATLVLQAGDQVGLQAQRLGGATAASITLYRLSLIKLQ